MGGIDDLAWLIRENQPCVALTGAGVSTVNRAPDGPVTFDWVRDADEAC